MRNYKGKKRPYSQKQLQKNKILYNKRAIPISRKLQNFTKNCRLVRPKHRGKKKYIYTHIDTSVLHKYINAIQF